MSYKILVHIYINKLIIMNINILENMSIDNIDDMSYNELENISIKSIIKYFNNISIDNMIYFNDMILYVTYISQINVHMKMVIKHQSNEPNIARKSKRYHGRTFVEKAGWLGG